MAVSASPGPSVRPLRHPPLTSGLWSTTVWCSLLTTGSARGRSQMDRSHWGMRIAVDVQYAERAAVTAAVGFIDWSTSTSTRECVLRTEVTPEPYEPGAFYRRELPFLREAVALVERRHPVEAVVIDGHVWLREGQPGLGARLYEALGARIAIIGVAKAVFTGGSAVPVLRGDRAL